MNRRRLTEEEMKALLEAPPTEEEIEEVNNILSQIPIKYLDKSEWH